MMSPGSSLFQTRMQALPQGCFSDEVGARSLRKGCSVQVTTKASFKSKTTAVQPSGFIYKTRPKYVLCVSQSN